MQNHHPINAAELTLTELAKLAIHVALTGQHPAVKAVRDRIDSAPLSELIEFSGDAKLVRTFETISLPDSVWERRVALGEIYRPSEVADPREARS